MPLFFLIAIGAGAFAVGAVTADVATDGHLGPPPGHTAQSAQVAQAPAFQASAYPTTADCLNAAAGRGIPASACQN